MLMTHTKQNINYKLTKEKLQPYLSDPKNVY